MSKSTKPRKKYRPREIQCDPVSWGIAGAYKVPFEKIDAVFAPIESAVLLLKQGRADRDDWNVVCQALNIAEAIAAMKVGDNLLPEILAGQGALRQIAQRMIERGTATCYAAELAAIDEALFMYRAQMKVCTQGELSRAIARVKELHRSAAMPDVARLYGAMSEKTKFLEVV